MNETLPTSPIVSNKRDLQVYGIIGAGVLLCLLAVLLAFPQLTSSFRLAQSAKLLSGVLPGALYVTDTEYASQLRTASYTGFAQVPFNGLLISARHTAKGLVSVVRDEKGVFNVRLDDKVLVQSTFAVASADISPDGAYVVYSVQTHATKPLKIVGGTVQFVTLATSDWTVVAHEITTGKNVVLGAGVHPFFVDATHVVRIAPAGIYMASVVTPEVTELVATHTPFVYMAPLISPDGAYVGIARADTRSIDVYHLQGVQAEHVKTIGLVQNASTYALSNTGLYLLRGDMMGPIVSMMPFSAPDTLRALGSIPKEMNVSRIIP